MSVTRMHPCGPAVRFHAAEQFMNNTRVQTLGQRTYTLPKPTNRGMQRSICHVSQSTPLPTRCFQACVLMSRMLSRMINGIVTLNVTMNLYTDSSPLDW